MESINELLDALPAEIQVREIVKCRCGRDNIDEFRNLELTIEKSRCEVYVWRVWYANYGFDSCSTKIESRSRSLENALRDVYEQLKKLGKA
jgi:hypothetical protein